MTSEEWGPWIEHDGKGCPCKGKLVQAAMAGQGPFSHGTFDGDVWEGYPTGIHCWRWDDYHPKIIRYRIRKPRAMKLLQSIVENPPKQLIKEDA